MNTMSLNEQSGFTLIELMVSLTLGLVIMLAAMQLFITNQIGFNLQRSMGDVQENGRFALDYMSSNIRSAGFTTNYFDSLPLVVVDESSLPTATTNKDKKVSCDDCFDLVVSSNVVKSDRIVVMQEINAKAGDFRSCEGNVIAAAANGQRRFVLSRFFVRSDAVANSNAALACDAGYFDEGDAAVTDFGDDGVVLLSNIDSFQVQYGIAANNAVVGSRFPERYINLTTYKTLAIPRPQISAVRLAAFVRSSDKVTSLLPVTQDVKVLDYSVSQNALADKYVRRLFLTTLALRNAM